MNSHLVTIEIGVERGTHKRMKLDCLTLYEDRLECLNTETVQCRSTVQHNRMLFDDVLEHIPDLSLKSLDHLLRTLDIMSGSVCNELLHDERLEQLDCHFFRKTALVNL